MSNVNHIKLIGAFLTVCGALSAQGQPQDENTTRMAAGSTPIYRVTVTGRTAKAINYKHRSGATKIDFRGTELLAGARGEAKVESKQGYIEIEVEFDGLQPAGKNGGEYLTYVLWAVTPEGRTSNLGEILLNGTKSKLDVTTELQTFALVVTAEPYYAVRQPSDLIVMENVVRADTQGKVEEVDAKYELLQRGQYQKLSNPLALKPDKRIPLEVYEARNAVQIARAMGADRFATETFQKAEKSLGDAEGYLSRKAGSKPVTMSAREAVQMAEDSRAIAVKRQDDDALSAERRQSVDRENQATTARAAAEAETDRVNRDAQAAKLQADANAARMTREKDAQTSAALAEADRVKRETDARLAAAAADADHAKQDSDARMAAVAADASRAKQESDARMAAAAADADKAKQESDARMAAAGVEANRLKDQNETQRSAMQAELDAAGKRSAELRSQLLIQFNTILQTRDTARGLVVNMSDVLFDSGKYSLRPVAREKLAKVAGIVSGHPGLKLEVEGHTDSIGGSDFNQRLSEQRGEAVRAYLTEEGMAASSVTAKGFGETQPVASNENAAGRQQNRRVELVISGEVIGSMIGIK
jgi:outer membrane protein OmpA-like peptidoglycan-associated protein